MKSIERLGESASKALLDHICSINELSEKELLTNYDLFEKSLYRVLRKGAEVILRDLKRELLVQAAGTGCIDRPEYYNQRHS